MNSMRWMGTSALALSLLAACGGGSDSGGSLTALAKEKGQVRTISGTLAGATDEVGVGVKTQSGKEVVATIDPKTGRFSATLPKGESAVLSIKQGGQLKRVKFPRKPEDKADAATDPTPFIPGDGFVKDANLGTIDVSGDGEEIIVGDDPDEFSIWNFVDADDDGTIDWSDPDAIGTELEDDWIVEDDDAFWDLFEDAALCDLDAEAVCEGNSFDEDLCAEGGPDAELWCTYEGDEDFYEPCYLDLIDLEAAGDECDAPCAGIASVDEACFDECWVDFCFE